MRYLGPWSPAIRKSCCSITSTAIHNSSASHQERDLHNGAFGCPWSHYSVLRSTQTLSIDLLNPSSAHESQNHKLKRLVQYPQPHVVKCPSIYIVLNTNPHLIFFSFRVLRLQARRLALTNRNPSLRFVWRKGNILDYSAVGIQ